MKLFRRLNPKGFSHVELFLVIVLVIALCGVGYFVWKHQGNSTTHAGSWTYVGTISPKGLPSVAIYACEKPINSAEKLVQSVAYASGAMASSYSLILNDHESNNGSSKDRWQTFTSNWPNNTANLNHKVSLNVDNWLQWTMVYYFVGPYSTKIYQAGTLSPCP